MTLPVLSTLRVSYRNLASWAHFLDQLLEESANTQIMQWSNRQADKERQMWGDFRASGRLGVFCPLLWPPPPFPASHSATDPLFHRHAAARVRRERAHLAQQKFDALTLTAQTCRKVCAIFVRTQQNFCALRSDKKLGAYDLMSGRERSYIILHLHRIDLKFCSRCLWANNFRKRGYLETRLDTARRAPGVPHRS